MKSFILKQDWVNAVEISDEILLEENSAINNAEIAWLHILLFEQNKIYYLKTNALDDAHKYFKIAIDKKIKINTWLGNKKNKFLKIPNIYYTEAIGIYNATLENNINKNLNKSLVRFEQALWFEKNIVTNKFVQNPNPNYYFNYLKTAIKKNNNNEVSKICNLILKDKILNEKNKNNFFPLITWNLSNQFNLDKKDFENKYFELKKYYYNVIQLDTILHNFYFYSKDIAGMVQQNKIIKKYNQSFFNLKKLIDDSYFVWKNNEKAYIKTNEAAYFKLLINHLKIDSTNFIQALKLICLTQSNIEYTSLEKNNDTYNLKALLVDKYKNIINNCKLKSNKYFEINVTDDPLINYLIKYNF